MFPATCGGLAPRTPPFAARPQEPVSAVVCGTHVPLGAVRVRPFGHHVLRSKVTSSTGATGSWRRALSPPAVWVDRAAPVALSAGRGGPGQATPAEGRRPSSPSGSNGEASGRGREPGLCPRAGAAGRAAGRCGRPRREPGRTARQRAAATTRPPARAICNRGGARGGPRQFTPGRTGARSCSPLRDGPPLEPDGSCTKM